MAYIIGIDPSISSTGYSIIESETKEIVKAGKITNKKLKGKTAPLNDRIRKVVNDIIRECKEYEVKVAYIENQFSGRNAKTTMMLCRLMGALIYGIESIGVLVFEMSPAYVRKVFAGSGDLSKEDIANIIINTYKECSIVKELGEFIDRECNAKNSDIYDAISIGLAGIISGDVNE